MNSSTSKCLSVAAQDVKLSAEALTVELTDGRRLAVPLAWYPRLLHGTPEERSNWRLIGKGQGIHWPDLDEDIQVDSLLFGKLSGESQVSLKRWLEQRKPAEHIQRINADQPSNRSSE